MQFDDFFCYKDIGSHDFFTMTTLLMPLFGNEKTKVTLNIVKVGCYYDAPDNSVYFVTKPRTLTF